MGVLFMSQKPVIYLGNLNIVRDSHYVHLLILHDNPNLYSITNALLLIYHKTNIVVYNDP